MSSTRHNFKIFINFLEEMKFKSAHLPFCARLEPRLRNSEQTHQNVGSDWLRVQREWTWSVYLGLTAKRNQRKWKEIRLTQFDSRIMAVFMVYSSGFHCATWLLAGKISIYPIRVVHFNYEIFLCLRIGLKYLKKIFRSWYSDLRE